MRFKQKRKIKTVIRVGNRVKIKFKHQTPETTGRVTKVIPGYGIEDHGFIHIKLDNGKEEHFVYLNWEKNLKVID